MTRSSPDFMTRRQRLLAAAVAACFASTTWAAGPTALPSGATNLVGVSAQNIVYGNNSLAITTSAVRSSADWDKFSIPSGMRVDILQPSASSAMLNRVLSADPSRIYGTLSSNGQVWLINQAGIQIGPGGVIDTARFVGSTLNVRAEDFLAGRLIFQATPGAGDVINQGTIKTPAGGSVYLVGANVSNEGLITTPQGETLLAAGQTVNLLDTATPGVKVEITGAEGNATNLGTVTAEAGRIGIAGVLVKNSGTLNASSAVSEGGRIFLKASQDVFVDGVGRIVSTGTKGGRAEVLGNRVAVMDQASIDVSGANGGGTILVGGDYQGKNPEIQNSAITYLGQDASLKADATDKGDGGKVIVWADDTTRAYGNISAKGGANGGNGGFVETSGKKYLDITGAQVNTMAPLGHMGLWLLDPENVYIVHALVPGEINATESPLGYFLPTNAGDNTTITDYSINSALATTSVAVTTYGSIPGAGGDGNIYFASDVAISKSAGVAANLDFNAYGSINVQGSFTNTSAGNLRVTFNPNKDAFNSANGAVYTDAGQTAVFNGGAGGGMEVRVFNGHIWKNAGTVTLNGNSYLTLPNIGSYATFHNDVGSVLNINSTSQFSVTSDPGTQGGIVNNEGTINVNGAYGGNATSWEALYTNVSGGVLNVYGGKMLSMQNANTLAGTINIGAGGTLWMSETHAGTRTLDDVTINGPGILQIGGGATAVNATFDNVTVSDATIQLGSASNSTGSISYIGSGPSSYTNTTFIAYGNLILPSGAPATASFFGDFSALATGNIETRTTGSTMSVPGALTLVAGWDGVTSASSIAGTYDSSGITGATGDLHFYGGSAITAGHMTLKASNNVRVGDVTSAYGGAEVHSAGYQKVYAKGNLNVDAASNTNYGSSLLAADGHQIITANSITLNAATAANTHDSSASIRAWGDQEINVGIQAAGGITLVAGGPTNVNGYNNRATIEHGQYSGGSFSGNQTINVGVNHGSSLALSGGGGDGTGGNADSTCASGCANSGNSAQIGNYSGDAAINFAYGGSLTVTGGYNGSNNSAEIHNETSGTLTINGATLPTITLTGGSSGGSIGTKVGGGVYYNDNSASISSEGKLVVYGSTISLTGGGGATGYANAFMGGSDVYIKATGTLGLTGGSSSSGNATTLGTAAAIGNDNKTKVVIEANDVTLQGGMSPGSWAMVGSMDGNADITIKAQNNLMLAGATQFSNRIGAQSAGGVASIDLQSGLGGTGTMGLGYGLVNAGTTGTVSLTAAGTGSSIAQAAGATGGAIRAQQLDIDASIGPGTVSLTGVNQIGLLNANTNGNLDFAGNQVTVGTITTTANNVTITTDNAILDDTDSSTRITANNITLNSTYGGSTGSLAISADTVATSNVSATASGTYGGISIRNYSTAPTFNHLWSNASYGNSVSLYNEASLNLAGASYNFLAGGAGDISIISGGNLTVASPTIGTGGGPTYGSVLFGASGDLTVGSNLTIPEDIALVAGGILDINAPITSFNNNVTLVGGTVKVDASVAASNSNSITLTGGTIDLTKDATAGSIYLAAGDVVASGGTAYLQATAGNIVGVVVNDVRLNDGAHFNAPLGEVDLTFLGPNSTLYLNDVASYANKSYINASPNTVYLDFLGRAKGGVVIDGVETTDTVAGSSGFYTGGYGGTPLTEGAGLDIYYALANTAIDAGILDTITQPPPGGGDDNTPPPPPPPPSGDSGSTLTPSGPQTIGGGEGEFGGDSGGTGEKNGDGKDKDKKKSANAKEGEKKDEKSDAKKPVAQCS